MPRRSTRDKTSATSSYSAAPRVDSRTPSTMSASPSPFTPSTRRRRSMSIDDRSFRGTGAGGSGSRRPRQAVGIEERVDDRAIGYGGAAALRGHGFEYLLELSQIANFAADFAHMIARQPFDFRASVSAAVDQTEQLADLLDRETEITAATDKVEPPDEAL